MNKDIEVKYEEIKARPLTDIMNEITHNGKTFIPFEYLEYDCKYEYFRNQQVKSDIVSCIGNDEYEKNLIRLLPYGLVIQLKEWGFNIKM